MKIPGRYGSGMGNKYGGRPNADCLYNPSVTNQLRNASYYLTISILNRSGRYNSGSRNLISTDDKEKNENTNGDVSVSTLTSTQNDTLQNHNSSFPNKSSTHLKDSNNREGKKVRDEYITIKLTRNYAGLHSQVIS